jgi:hypothetical protein
MKKYSKAWWLLWFKYALIRALKTVAQTAVGMASVSAMMHEVNWIAVGSASLLSGIISMLTSLAGLPEVDPPKEEKQE